MKVKTYKYTKTKGWNFSEIDHQLDEKNTLILFFGSRTSERKEEALAELTENFPLSTVIGCSTAGEIFRKTVIDDSIVISIIQFENSVIKSFRKELSATKDSYSAANKIAKDLLSKDLKAVITLSDGLISNGCAVARGFNDVFRDRSISVFGGLAGDGDRFQKTWLTLDKNIFDRSIVAVGIYGQDLVCHTGIGSGWDIFGLEKNVTRSKGNVLFELDGKKALDVYKKYLGARSKDLPSSGLRFPLQVRSKENPSKTSIRTVLGIDEKEASITFAGEIPMGGTAQMMMANPEKLIDSAYDASEIILKKLYLDKHVALPEVAIESSYTLVISCVGRKLVLGERTCEEADAIVNALGRKANIGGFYSYGELSSQSINNYKCYLQNQSLSLMTLVETKKSIEKKEAA